MRTELFRDRAYIDGVWVGAKARIEVRNPANNSVVGTVPDLGAQEAETAVAAAARAFAVWRAKTGKERASHLMRWKTLMLEHEEALARLLTTEQGKPLAEARDEVRYAAGFLEWFSEEAKRVTGDVLAPHQHDKRLMVWRQPIGVVAAITPWNFPLAMVTRKAGPALAVGCTMVLKPSELTPYSALALAWLSEQAGIPPGVFNVVTGQAAPIGQILTSDVRVRKLSFTGSTAVGKKLAAQCMDTVKRVSLELGGNAPFIVFDDANVDDAVEGALASKFRNAGQTCVCSNRFFIQSGIYEEFAKRFADRMRGLVAGSGLASESNLGPLIDARAVAKVEAHVADALAKGGRLLAGGKRIEGPGSFFEPTVIADLPLQARLCREETFGPVAGLIRFHDDAEVVALANDTPAGLAAYVYTTNLDRSWRLSESLDYGMIGLNTGLISTESIPFGGVKESGIGREGSKYGVDDYLQYKALCLSLSKIA